LEEISMEDSLIGEIFFLIVAAGVGWALKGVFPRWFKKDEDNIENSLSIGMSVQATEDINMGTGGIFVTLHEGKRFRGLNRTGRMVKRGEILTVIDIHGILPAVGNKKATPPFSRLR
jgi:hypothetical protein